MVFGIMKKGKKYADIMMNKLERYAEIHYSVEYTIHNKNVMF